MLNGKYGDQRILVSFVDSMIREKGDAEGRSQADRDTLRRVLMDRLNEALEKATLAALPDEKLTELERILDNDGSDAELEAFFAGTAEIDTTPALEQAMAKFRADYLAGTMTVDLDKEAERERAQREELANNSDEEMVIQNEGDVAIKAPVEGGQVMGTTENSEPMSATEGGETMKPAGMPVQGVESEVQGQSNVEGVETERSEQANGLEEER